MNRVLIIFLMVGSFCVALDAKEYDVVYFGYNPKECSCRNAVKGSQIACDSMKTIEAVDDQQAITFFKKDYCKKIKKEKTTVTCKCGPAIVGTMDPDNTITITCTPTNATLFSAREDGLDVLVNSVELPEGQCWKQPSSL